MQLFKKTAAIVLAAAISFASVNAVAYADNSGISALEKVELTLDATKKPSKTTLKVTSTRSGYKFSWKKVSGIKAYEIYASKDGGLTYERIATVESNKTSKTITNLDISKTYKFRIRSYKTSGSKKVYSKFSNIVSIRPVTEAATVDLGKASDTNTTPKMSSKQLDLTSVPVSKINSNLAYVVNYLGQDLYVIKEKDSDKKQVYKVTKSALRSYKATGKLKADKIKLDSPLDNATWEVYASQLDKCNNAIFSYSDDSGKTVYVTVSYDESAKKLNVIHQTRNQILTLSKEGYSFEYYYKDKDETMQKYNEAVVEIYMPDGRIYKRLIYNENDNCYSKFTTDVESEGFWYSNSGTTHSSTRWVDRYGNETVSTQPLSLATYGDKNYVVYFLNSANYDPPVSEYKVFFPKTNKSYKFSDLDVITIGADKDYDLSNISGIKGTTAIGIYRSDSPSDSYIPGTFKYSLINFANGKMLTPVYDKMVYNTSTKTYLAYTSVGDYKVTGAWYYSDNGKKLAKFDDGSMFTKNGYALVSNGKSLFFVNKKFERVSAALKFSSSSGWESVEGNKGIMTYSSGNNGYFVVYA